MTTVYKAQPTGDQVIPDLDISATHTVPSLLSYIELAELYERQAQEVAAALWASLPGGTLDRLLAAMLTRHASMFRVTRLPKVEP